MSSTFRLKVWHIMPSTTLGATASLVSRLVADDPGLLAEMGREQCEWPALSPRRTPRHSREVAAGVRPETPRFMQRVLAKVHHDTDDTPADALAYLSLIDRILEDRVIDDSEHEVLANAIAEWNLSPQQIDETHRNYVHSLAVHALSDGVVTGAERTDLYNVARLLGLSSDKLDTILRSAQRQLAVLKDRRATETPSNELLGKRVCFTGELSSTVDGTRITRDIAESLAASAGLDIANSVTKALDILVVADPDTQSGKAKKARKYGTRIMAEPAFWRMIGVEVH